jgi:hypothetical protein
MNSSDFFTSACRHCKHYCPEGRRGGHCSQLNVSVQGTWKACPLASPIFEPTWEFQAISVWQGEEVGAVRSSASSTSHKTEVSVAPR